MAENSAYNRSYLCGSQPGIGNTAFDSRSVEFVDAKPTVPRANYIYWGENLYISGPTQFKPMSFRGELYIHF